MNTLWGLTQKSFQGNFGHMRFPKIMKFWVFDPAQAQEGQNPTFANSINKGSMGIQNNHKVSSLTHPGGWPGPI